ncbi:transporter, putative [Minicystis rosea]|nr:transporter, putative [Minicystis rosea]
MLRLLRAHPAFRRLWLAAIVSQLGDWLSVVAVALLALDRDGGARSIAIVFAAHSLPQALFSPIAGVVADRFDRRRVLLAVPLAQAAVTLAMAAAAARGSVGLVQALVLARGMIGAFMVPAETAALRRTVPAEDLLHANTLVSGTWSVTFIAGMALGGVLATLGPAPAMVIDALSFLVAAALLWALPTMLPEGPARERKEGVLSAFASDLANAYRHAAAHPALFRRVFGKAPLALAGGAGWIAIHLVAAAVHPLGTAAISLGVIQAVRGAGTGIGPALAGPLAQKHPRAVDHAAAFLSFAGVVLFPLTTQAPLILLIALVWGMGVGANWVLSSAGVQRHASDGIIGRLASLDELTTIFAMVSGSIIGAEVATRTGSTATAATVGAAMGAVAWCWLHRARKNESKEEEAATA